MTKKILLTNDDGIWAPGIAALYKELKNVAQVVVVAPDGERSSVGHGITLSHPVWCKTITREKIFTGHAVTGTPADCVKFAASVVLKRKPDLLVSGINHGANDGCSVFYSGTVAAAREGALLGIPSMAVSLATFGDPDFRTAAKYGARLARMLLKQTLAPGTFLNVNVPALPAGKIKGIRVTRQGTDPIFGSFARRKDPLSRDYYWMTGRPPRHRRKPDVDTYALNEAWVTVTPIQCDLTDDAALNAMRQWPLA